MNRAILEQLIERMQELEYQAHILKMAYEVLKIREKYNLQPLTLDEVIALVKKTIAETE